MSLPVRASILVLDSVSGTLHGKWQHVKLNVQICMYVCLCIKELVMVLNDLVSIASRSWWWH